MKRFLVLALVYLFVTASCTTKPVPVTDIPTVRPTLLPTLISTVVNPPPSATPVPELKIPPGFIYCLNGLWYSTSEGEPKRISPYCGYYNSPGFSSISPDGVYFLYEYSYYGLAGNDIWVTNLLTGETRNLTNTPDSSYRYYFLWSPDSRYVYYNQDEDIWRVEAATGKTLNVTNTPDRDEGEFGFWPAQNALVFLSAGKDEHLGPGEFHLAIAGMDGSNYRLLTADTIYAMPVVSPDGKTLAFQGGSLLRPGGGIQPIKFNVESEDSLEDVNLDMPAWVSDGTRIVWSATAYKQDGSWFECIGIYNLMDNSLKLLHFYNIMGGEGPVNAPVWSPDGQWLALVEINIDEDKDGTWVIRTDGTEEHYLGKYFHPIWSADGSWVAYEGYFDGDDESDLGFGMTEIGSWRSEFYNLSQYPDLIGGFDPEKASGWISMIVFDVGYSYQITPAGNGLQVYDAAALDAKVLGQLQSGDEVVIVGGPEFRDGFSWWKVRVRADGLEGWCIEHHAWFAPIE